MGLVYAEIELISTVDIALHIRGFLSEGKIKRVRTRALVDSGAYMLVITDHIRQQLDLPLIQEQVFRLADDSELKGEVVGPVEVHFENRSTTVRAVVLPGAEEPLLGSIPLGSRRSDRSETATTDRESQEPRHRHEVLEVKRTCQQQ